MNGESPRRVEARRGSSVVYRGKALLSLIDPIARASRLVEALAPQKQTLYLCPSPLLWYGLRELLDRMTPDSAVLCVEGDRALYRLSLENLPADLAGHPKLRFARLEDGAEACRFARAEFGPRRFRRVVPVKLSGGRDLDPAAYDGIETALRQDIALEWSNAMTLVKLGRRYALNAVRNLALLPVCRPLSADLFGARPVLVLGAGPSLDSVPELLRARRGYRIVCVDTALIPLRERGVSPDLAVAVEAQHWNLRDFIGVPGPAALALDLSSLPRVATAASGERRLFLSPWTPLRLLDRLREAALLPPELPPLGSVGLTAVAAALRAGTGPVVAAGLDFSYGIGAYHARSAPSRLDGLFRTDRLRPLIDPAPAFRKGVVSVADKSGGTVLTDPALRGYRGLFEREFGRSDRISDAGDRGLELGVRRVSVAEAERILSSDGPDGNEPGAGAPVGQAGNVIGFIDAELERLEGIRATLTGRAGGADLDAAVDDCDYLWAHFPECAGNDGERPPLSDAAFLKRVRAEIDPFLKAFRLARSELERLG